MKILFLILLTVTTTQANELLTNATHMNNPPSWINKTRVDKVVDPIQSVLEWDIHRVEVYWYTDQAAFQKVHNYGPRVLAVSKKQENAIYIGPRVTSENFDQVFGHELVHVISYQKYKDAIPLWLEEGLANHTAKAATVDYKWLAGKPFPKDVHELTHPFAGTNDDISYHYMASQALIEMIASKCDFRNLMRLSVGRKMEDYLDTYCNIKDLNGDYQKWVSKKDGPTK